MVNKKIKNIGVFRHALQNSFHLNECTPKNANVSSQTSKRLQLMHIVFLSDIILYVILSYFIGNTLFAFWDAYPISITLISLIIFILEIRLLRQQNGITELRFRNLLEGSIFCPMAFLYFCIQIEAYCQRLVVNSPFLQEASFWIIFILFLLSAMLPWWILNQVYKKCQLAGTAQISNEEKPEEAER